MIAEGQSIPAPGPRRPVAFRSTEGIAPYPTLLTPGDLQEDSVAARGARDGKDEARSELVAHRAAMAFIAGVPTGFLLPFVCDRASPGLTPVLVGGGIIVLTAWVGDRTPDDSAQPSDRGPVYQRAFLAAYAKEIGRRRRNAALLGGAAPGIGIGLGTAIWLTSVFADMT
jgi:hypothetical protein